MKRFLPVVVIVILLIIIRNISMSIHSMINNQNFLNGLEQETFQKKQESKFLTQQLEYVKKDSYVEQEARDKLGMVKNGETIVIIPSPSITPSQISIAPDTQPNWLKWWKLFF